MAKSKKQETAELLKGVFKEITVLVSRKRTDGNYGSYDVSYGATINVPDATTNVEELAASLDAYLTAAVSASMKQKGETELRNTEPAQQELPEPTEPIRTPIDDSGQELAEMQVDKIEVLFSKKGNKYARVFGGNWVKRGVACWKEVLAMAPLEWNIDELDAQIYTPPPGVKALVKMGEYEGKPSPEEVVGWK